MGGIAPGAGVSVYCATKAFNRILSIGMGLEYSHAIDVMTVCPRNVKSNMNSGRYAFTVTAEAHAKAVID